MLKDKVGGLLSKALEEDGNLFLIDFSISPDNKIRIVLDGDKGVTVEDCVKVSRAIEHNLDREEEDFSLEVASAGATSHMVYPRQYKKNIGRTLKVGTQDANFEGLLSAVDENGIVLEWKSREPKPNGKGKVTVLKTKGIPFSQIKEAKVVLKF